MSKKINFKEKDNILYPETFVDQIIDFSDKTYTKNQIDGKIPEEIVSTVNNKTGDITLSGADLIVSMSWSETISDVLSYLYSEKSSIDHGHSIENISQLRNALDSIKDSIKVNSVNGKVGNIVLTSSDIDVSNGVSVTDVLNNFANDFSEALNLKSSSDHTHKEYAEKRDIPNRLSLLDNDINAVTSDIERNIIVSEVEPVNIKEGDIWIRI